MKTLIRGSLSALVLGAAVIAGVPGAARAEALAQWNAPYDAVLYELNENMSLRALLGGSRRATSNLMGFARAGTPLCPPVLANGKAFCTINATGSDDISVATGLGLFGGTFTVVGDGDNAVDGPEAVLATGRFSGKMDFSPAILANVPLGSVRGIMTLNGGGRYAFTGTFRLPFVVPMQDPACVAVNGATGCEVLGYTEPLYLLDPTTFRTDWVTPDERAIGYPTVRFEITFD